MQFVFKYSSSFFIHVLICTNSEKLVSSSEGIICNVALLLDQILLKNAQM